MITKYTLTILGSILFANLAVSDSIVYYLGADCTNEALATYNDIGTKCYATPENAQSFQLTQDDGYAYFRYSSDDCFEFVADINFNGCLGIDSTQGINKRPINGDAELSRVDQRIAIMNQTRIAMGYTNWAENAARNIATMKLQKRRSQYIEERNPGDTAFSGNYGGTNYAAIEGDESGPTERISAGEAAAVAEDIEDDYRTDATQIQGSTVNTNVEVTLTITLQRGTFSQFDRDFVGTIADQVLSFIRGGNDSTNYMFDLGTLDDRSFTRIGNIIYNAKEGRGLKVKRGRIIVKTKPE